MSDGNEILLMQIRTVCEGNAQRTMSDGNETLSMQIRTNCEQKCAENDQRRESDSVDADAHQL